ncbi:hypothetical protein D3261_10990 [Halococcus sp. IIIV-5B]|nr:hypothetical protein D3261_10990 [Halococcus sp. IIIV-5B]
MATAEPTPSGPWTVTGRADGPMPTTRSIETQASTSGETTPETTTVNHSCEGARDLSFYALDNPPSWTRQTVYVAYSLETNANVVLVVFEGDTVLGSEGYRSPDGGVAVDGQPIRLNEPLTGEHTIRAVMYADPGDGEFDPGSATPCRYEGEVVQTGPETIDFGSFASSTTTETD